MGDDLTRFQIDLLTAVADAETDPSGQDILRAVRDFHGTDIPHSRVYQNLQPMVDDMGLLSKREVDGRTDAYTLTSRGRAELKRRAHWLQAAILADGDG